MHASAAQIANGSETVLVEEPEREQQQRARERDRVKLREREPLRRGEEQVRDREAESGPLAVEVLAREPVDGQRAERDRDRLRDEQQLGAGPEQPERREEHEDRVEVGGEAARLLAGEVRHCERIAVCRRPNGLRHVPEVEAARVERAMSEHGERPEPGRERRDDERRALGSTRALENREPAPAEDVFARVASVRGQAARGDARA